MARILLRQRFDGLLDERLEQMAEDVERELKTHARVDTGEMRRLTRSWPRYSGQSTGGRGITVRVQVPYAGVVDAVYGYGRADQADINVGPTVIELVERGMNVGLRGA